MSIDNYAVQKLTSFIVSMFVLVKFKCHGVDVIKPPPPLLHCLQAVGVSSKERSMVGHGETQLLS